MKLKKNFNVGRSQPKIQNLNQVFTVNQILQNMKNCQNSLEMAQNSLYYRQPIKKILSNSQEQINSINYSSSQDKENDLQGKIQIYKQKLNNNRNQIVELRQLQNQILHQNKIIRQKLQQINLIIQQDNKQIFILDKQLNNNRRTYNHHKVNHSQKYLNQLKKKNKQLKLKAQEYLLNKKLAQIKKEQENQKPSFINFSKNINQKRNQNTSYFSNDQKQEQVTKEQIQQLLHSQYLKQILKNKIYGDNLKNKIKELVNNNMQIDTQLKELIYS